MKTLAVCTRYFDENVNSVTTKFWSLVQIFDYKSSDTSNTGGTAERLYDELIKSFEDTRIPLTNIIDFASDGCNVMFGKNNSVASRMKQLQDGIVVMKCICHSLHLCVSEACKVLPKHSEDLARNIYNFNHSSKRQAALQEFQDFCNVEPHKLLRPAQIRWLSLLQWDALKLFFTSQWMEEKLVAAENLFHELNDVWLRLYYLFLDWVLPKVVKMNEYFQSEKVVITVLHLKMVEMFTELLSTYMNPHVIMKNRDLNNLQPDNEQYFLPLSQIYLGHIAENGGDHFHPTKNMLDLMTTSNLYLHLRCNTKEQNEDNTDRENKNVHAENDSDADEDIVIEILK
ncbi:putative zinc finger protein 862 [Lasius niger]|uniref:Putative zinc finger protein 862 n=1 Tax=Lasius niger TaxID=67767 RepID=A0A0J7K807_LASNI|nr:putative zinc finger protein 862 [Lasius niger]